MKPISALVGALFSAMWLAVLTWVTPYLSRSLKWAETGLTPSQNKGHEMRQPFKVELWKPVDDTPHVLAVTESFEAAEKAYQEAVANLRALPSCYGLARRRQCDCGRFKRRS